MKGGVLWTNDTNCQKSKNSDPQNIIHNTWVFARLTVKLKNNVWYSQVFQRRFAPIGGCPLCFGIGVRNGLEWVSENSWNQCPDSSEYALRRCQSFFRALWHCFWAQYVWSGCLALMTNERPQCLHFLRFIKTTSWTEAIGLCLKRSIIQIVETVMIAQMKRRQPIARKPQSIEAGIPGGLPFRFTCLIRNKNTGRFRGGVSGVRIYQSLGRDQRGNWQHNQTRNII